MSRHIDMSWVWSFIVLEWSPRVSFLLVGALYQFMSGQSPPTGLGTLFCPSNQPVEQQYIFSYRSLYYDCKKFYGVRKYTPFLRIQCFAEKDKIYKNKTSINTTNIYVICT